MTLARACVLVALPLGATILLATVALAEIAGAHPFTHGAPQNASEAAAMRDDASLLRLLAGSSGARRLELIRPGILGEGAVLATPAEAAVLSHDRGALELLAPRAAWTAADRAHLACLARDVHDAALAGVFDGSPAVACAPADGLEQVLQRR